MTESAKPDSRSRPRLPITIEASEGTYNRHGDFTVDCVIVDVHAHDTIEPGDDPTSKEIPPVVDIQILENPSSDAIATLDRAGVGELITALEIARDRTKEIERSRRDSQAMLSGVSDSELSVLDLHELTIAACDEMDAARRTALRHARAAFKRATEMNASDRTLRILSVQLQSLERKYAPVWIDEYEQWLRAEADTDSNDHCYPLYAEGGRGAFNAAITKLNELREQS